MEVTIIETESRRVVLRSWGHGWEVICHGVFGKMEMSWRRRVGLVAYDGNVFHASKLYT